MVNGGVNHQAAARPKGCQLCKPVARSPPVNTSASGMREERVDSSADCTGAGAQIARLCVGTRGSR